ncbi:DNA polymerase III subunit delta' [Paenibacillus sp. y28]|uniref:DNA polymerase III subunit delta' n=1 Tax=Paenibacillus sp. y28 TaxID=3129110 RepID=UPI00301A5FAB
MSFDQIPGQEKAKRILQNALRSGRLSHAYMFTGPLGTGRKAMALTLAQAIFCTERQDDACGRCLECRKVEHGNHPDVFHIEPVGTSIKIDQIRELQKEFAFRTTSSGAKVYIIQEADRMTIQAANSLLKFLEEPQSRIIAVLLTENGQAVLPTIRSRSQWIPFTPLAASELAPILVQEGAAPELARAAAELTAGLGAAREFIHGNWFAEVRGVMIQLMKECCSRSPDMWLTLQQKVMKGEAAQHLETFFDLLFLWFKDMILVRCGKVEHLVYIDQAEWLKKMAFSKETGSWARAMERASEMKKRLRYHVNPQLALEQFLLDVQGE